MIFFTLSGNSRAALYSGSLYKILTRFLQIMKQSGIYQCFRVTEKSGSQDVAPDIPGTVPPHPAVAGWMNRDSDSRELSPGSFLRVSFHLPHLLTLHSLTSSGKKSPGYPFFSLLYLFALAHQHLQ